MSDAAPAGTMRVAQRVRPGPPTDGRLLSQRLDEAAALQRSGQLEKAAACYHGVLRLEPEHAAALCGLGIIRAQQGQLGVAVNLLGRGVLRDPASAEAHNNLGMVLQAAQRNEEAALRFEAAIKIRPHYAIALNNLGLALASLGRTSEAISRYREALAVQPLYPEALNNLGAALHAAGRADDAIDQFQSALAIRPEFIDARINLAHAQASRGRHAEAAASYRQVLTVQPGNAVVYLNLADIAFSTHDHESAIRHYEQARRLQPRLADAHAGLGMVFQEVGRIGEARACFEQAIHIEPRCTRHYLNLARNDRMLESDPYFPRLLALADQMESFVQEERINLHFALGKALADIGRHAESFDHLLAGNALKRQSVSYDARKDTTHLRHTVQVFSGAFIASRKGHGDLSDAPVFILGMPRSGSTLVEQILAAHSKVFAAGELPSLREAIGAVTADGSRGFPDAVRQWKAADFRALGRDYVRRLAAVAVRAGRHDQAQRITDKMPSNFVYAGLIPLMLPNARIIHTRRDPVDTCLSCFSLLFHGLPFTYDLGELGRRYHAYSRLMAHWHGVIPAGMMLDVQYEALVANPEEEARRIIAHCGLEWEEDCLRFHEVDRPVHTASVVQVRQPIYRHAVGRWRPPEHVLRPLLDALADDEIDADAAGAGRST